MQSMIISQVTHSSASQLKWQNPKWGLLHTKWKKKQKRVSGAYRKLNTTTTWISTIPWRHMGEWKVYLHSLLTSTPDGGQYSPSNPATLPAKTLQVTHWIRSQASSTAVLNVLQNRKIYCPHRESNPQSSVALTVSQSLELPWNLFMWQRLLTPGH